MKKLLTIVLIFSASLSRGQVLNYSSAGEYVHVAGDGSTLFNMTSYIAQKYIWPNPITWAYCGAHFWLFVSQGNLYTVGFNTGSTTPVLVNRDSAGNAFPGTHGSVVKAWAGYGGNYQGSGEFIQILCSDGTVHMMGWLLASLRCSGGVYMGSATNPYPVQAIINTTRPIVDGAPGAAIDDTGGVYTWGGSQYGSATGINTTLLGQGNAPSNTNLGTKLNIPGHAKTIVFSGSGNFVLTKEKQVFGWGQNLATLGIGYINDRGFGWAGRPFGQSTVPIWLDTAWGALGGHVVQLTGNNSGIAAIDDGNNLWTQGDVSQGQDGWGLQIPWGIYPSPYQSNQNIFQAYDGYLGMTGVQQRKPVQVAIGIKFAYVIGNNTLGYYLEAYDVHGRRYAWGRNKGDITTDAFASPNTQLDAWFADLYNRPWVTCMDSAKTFGTTVTTAWPPYCYDHPTSDTCTPYTLPAKGTVAAQLTASSTGSTIFLDASATSTSNGQAGWQYLFICTSSSSGLTPSPIACNSARYPFYDLPNGVYNFQVQVTSTSWDVGTSSTVTVTVNSSSSGINSFISKPVGAVYNFQKG